MGKLLRQSRYLILFATVFLGITTVAAFAWGAAKTFRIIATMVQTFGQYPDTVVPFIELIDAFLVATVLLIVTASLYDLSFETIGLPDWMVAQSFEQLKSKLSGMIVLVMAVKFLEQFMAWQDSLATMQFGLGMAAVAAVLIVLNRFAEKGDKSLQASLRSGSEQ